MSEGEKIADAILPLLQEYTQRLRNECEGYLNGRTSMFLPIGLMVAGAGVVVAAAVKLGWKDIPRRLPDFMYLIMACAGFAGVVLGIRYALLFDRRSILKRHEIRTTAARLEKIIRMGSQLEDHAIEDMATRMQLQLRLADGEAALALVDVTLDPGISIRRVELMGATVHVGREESARVESTPTAGAERLRERHP